MQKEDTEHDVENEMEEASSSEDVDSDFSGIILPSIFISEMLVNDTNLLSFFKMRILRQEILHPLVLLSRKLIQNHLHPLLR